MLLGSLIVVWYLVQAEQEQAQQAQQQQQQVVLQDRFAA
jgi:hypothetical protein